MPAKKKGSKKTSSRKTTAKAREEGTPTKRRCATDIVHERLLRHSPGYADARAQVESHCFRMARAQGLVQRTGCTEIPVVVHVVYRTAAENISMEQIESQIDVLNADFRKKNADVSSVPSAFAPLAGDARLQFALATEDPDGNPTDGVTRRSTTVNGFATDDSVKFDSSGGTDAWPRDRYLNIWVCRISGGILGYAQFPGGPADTDGVVVLHSAFGTTGTAASPFDKGRTTTHEIGHWLNLRHIWGDDGTGCSGSDFVADTPNQGGPNYGTPSFPKTSCSNGPDGDMFMNYMDYVDDAAMIMFSTGQIERMHATLDGVRSGIGTSIPCESIGPKLKIVDDPITLKFSDDQPTLKFSDDQPTLKFIDDPTTLKFIDDPITLKFSDDGGTLKFIDDGGTLKFTDDPGTLKFVDDGSNPIIDPVKSPSLDKPPFTDGGWPFGGFFDRAGGQGGATQPSGVPFVLSTPHHSTAWAASYPGAADARVSQLEEQLKALHQMLEQAEQARATGRLQPQDEATIQNLQQEFQRLHGEYLALTGGQR